MDLKVVQMMNLIRIHMSTKVCKKQEFGLSVCLYVTCTITEKGRIRVDIKMKTQQSMYNLKVRNIARKPEWIYNLLFT